MPVNIVGYYNNYCANELIRETEATNVRTSIGRGFRLNYQQTVLPSTQYGLSGTNAQNYPYVYTDGDGTEHYIQKVTENSKTVYKDEDGLGLTLATSFDEEGTYRITDKSHNKYYFNSKGNLFRIIDNNGNEVQTTEELFKLFGNSDETQGVGIGNFSSQIFSSFNTAYENAKNDIKDTMDKAKMSDRQKAMVNKTVSDIDTINLTLAATQAKWNK